MLCDNSSISFVGCLFFVTTLSRKCIAFLIHSRSLSQSIPSLFALINFATFIEPRLQLSFGSSGTSPHGFVDSILKYSLTGFELLLFILSIKINPGSAHSHAQSIIFCHSSLALILSPSPPHNLHFTSSSDG